MSDEDIARLSRIMQGIRDDLDAHLRDTGSRAALTHDRLRGLEERMTAVEAEMPDQIRAVVADEIKQAGERVRRLLVWLAALALVISQLADTLRGVWQ